MGAISQTGLKPGLLKFLPACRHLNEKPKSKPVFIFKTLGSKGKKIYPCFYFIYSDGILPPEPVMLPILLQTLFNVPAPFFTDPVMPWREKESEQRMWDSHSHQ